MERKGIITIGAPYIADVGDTTRIVSKINFDDQDHDLWFAVPKEFGKYLCPERTDGFILATLYKALHEGYDINCETPVTSELLHNIETILIDCVMHAVPDLYRPKITAEQASCVDRDGKVGTAVSCGVDSLHAIRDYGHSKYARYAIDYLVLFNVGGYWKGQVQFDWQIQQAQAFAAEYGYKFLLTDSNLHDIFPSDHLFSVKYSNGFGIYMLQKLWGKYLYASDGYDFRDCKLTEHDIENSVWMDAIAGLAFTTPGLQVVPEALPKTRFDKIVELADFEPAHKYMDVCVLVGTGRKGAIINCGKCWKCRRTLLILDAIGALDKFGKVFDIEYYKSHRDEYYQWMLEQSWIPNGDGMIGDSLKALWPRIPAAIKAKDRYEHLKFRLGLRYGVRPLISRFFIRHRRLHLIFRRYIRRYPDWATIKKPE